MCDKLNKDLTGYMRASYPLIYITSSEEERVERIVGRICNSVMADGSRMADLFVWEEGVGIKAGHEELSVDENFKWADIAKLTASLGAFVQFISTKSEESVEAADCGKETKWDGGAFIAKDLHYLFKNPNPILYRLLRVFARNAKVVGQSLIVIGPPVELPDELRHEFVVLDCDLPDKGDIRKCIAELGESLDLSGDLESADAVRNALELEGDLIVDAAKGMTESEVVGSAALSLVQSGQLDREFITQQKVSAIKKSGFLEVWPTEQIGHVGGMAELKKYLDVTEKAFTKEARDFGLKEPRGILAVGVPGTGKSLVAKAAASVFKRPLIRFDVGSVFGSLVGDSEKNMRNAIKTAEAAAPCVLFIDEIEKAFAGSGGGSNDGGTSVRVFGSFLSWMQDHKEEVYVIATANQVDNLPPELLRKGRFDDIFFSDLPTDNERAEIFSIHLTKVGRDPKAFDMDSLVRLSEDYSGAEIEQAVQDALGNAFADGAGDVTDKYLADAIDRTKPLSQTRGEDISKMRDHGKKHFRAASCEDRKAQTKKVRTVRRIQAKGDS